MGNTDYCRGGQRFGPLPAEQLRSMAASGELHVDDMVWKEGMANRSRPGGG